MDAPPVSRNSVVSGDFFGTSKTSSKPLWVVARAALDRDLAQRVDDDLAAPASATAGTGEQLQPHGLRGQFSHRAPRDVGGQVTRSSAADRLGHAGAGRSRRSRRRAATTARRRPGAGGEQVAPVALDARAPRRGREPLGPGHEPPAEERDRHGLLAGRGSGA